MQRDFVARERLVVHVLWMSGGLGCDGESVAMTSATSPSLEDLLSGVIPGCPKIVLHNPLLAFEVGDDFMRAWYDAEDGALDPFVLILEGAIGNERINGDGHWTGFGVDPIDGQPITVNEWIDRLAPKAAAVMAVGTCATYGGVPAMKNNPTGAMGLPDYLGWDWRAKSGVPIVCIPGCPTQPDNMTGVLLELVQFIGGDGPAPELDEKLRPKRLFERTVRVGCGRAGFTEQGLFAKTYGNDPRCLVKPRLQGPDHEVQRARTRVGQRHRGLPERRRHLHRLHDARLPGQVHALHGPRSVGQLRGELPALHLRPAVSALPQAQPHAEVRRGARMARARAGAAQRSREALVAHGHVRGDPPLAGLPRQTKLLPPRAPPAAWRPAAVALGAQVPRPARGGARGDGHRRRAQPHRARQRAG